MIKNFEKSKFLFYSFSFIMEPEPKLGIFSAPAPKLWFKALQGDNARKPDIFIHITHFKGIGTRINNLLRECILKILKYKYIQTGYTKSYSTSYPVLT